MFAASKTSTASSGYQISRSLRFNSADSTNLNRTLTTATNRNIWTWSGWLKRSVLDSSFQCIFSSSDGAIGNDFFGYNQTVFRLAFFGGTYVLQSSSSYRDPSAFYHVVIATDTTQATSTNRAKVYINGVQVTSWATETYPPQNYSSSINGPYSHQIGAILNSSYNNMMLTEVNFIDGQQLTPSSFGETNAQTGVWQPKAYSGSYGTNGFYLNFSDNSNTTAATLGKDYSGNGNNWTPNNFSVTAGAGNDSLVDSPTSYGTDTGVGGTVRGNYCTWNPLYPLSNITNGNLDFSIGSGQGPATSSIYVTSGKWYFEVTPTAITGTSIGEISITDSKLNMAAGYRSTGTKDVDSFSTNAAYGATWTVGDNIGVAFDVDNKQVTFYKNGVSQGAITYTGSSLTTNSMGVLADWRTSATFAGTGNFGQRPFAYTAPSGFKALCTQNLPTPTIGATTATQASKFFAPTIYTQAAGANTITTGLDMSTYGGLIWEKPRSIVESNYLTDTVRGLTKYLVSNTTAAEGTTSTYIQSVTSTGYTTAASTWANGTSMVSWDWIAGGTAVTNTSGSITSTVSANTTSGFSVVTYTGTGPGNFTVGHGLGVAPSMIILKNRDRIIYWMVYTATTGINNFLRLNTTDVSTASTGIWGTSAPTSTVFGGAGTDTGNGYVSGEKIVAYCFAEVAGYSKFGSYTGNGSADGPFVFTGMRPAYVMVKRTDGAGSWQIFDDTRSPINGAGNVLFANGSDAEANDSNRVMDLVSNGFKLRAGAPVTPEFNNNGSTYIFMAFAKAPQKFSLAR